MAFFLLPSVLSGPQHLLNFKFDPHGQGAFLPILWLAHTSCLGFNLRERASSSGSGSHGFLVNVATSIIFLLPELLPILSHWFACNWYFFGAPNASTS